MKTIINLIFVLSFITWRPVTAQTLDKVKFFEDTSIIDATISANMGDLYRHKDKPGAIFPAKLRLTLEDGTPINDTIALATRGHFRKGYCEMPPIKIIFDYDSNAFTSPLKDLKLVNRCMTSEIDQQYLLKEFLIYKMYNMITDMSFRVRLLKLNFVDNADKKKPLSEYSFLMESIKGVAKRNDCKYREDGKMDPRNTDRMQMATVAIFEYMIGNTDWSVGAGHNTKLLISKTDSNQAPYVVPYDFDYSGLVATDYSTPDPMLNITSVHERLYRGFPKTIGEINTVLDTFRKQKDSIYNLVNNFDLLTSRSKKEMTSYLDGFFEMINNPKEVKKVFIENARTE